jgi:hypothetical protein
MMHYHHLPVHDRELIMRAFWAAILALGGLWILLRPNAQSWLSGAGCYFRTPDDLTPDQVSRLDRTLEARRQAETAPQPWHRWLGILALAAAVAQIVPAVPYAIPYAVFCLGLAGSRWLSYSSMHRATQRRAAALVRRSPMEAFQPFLMLGVGAALASVVLMAWVAPLRVPVAAVAIATGLLIWIMWQIASSRALLFGNDPKMEYAVDRRIREGRVMNLALLACAPAFVLVAPSSPLVPEVYRSLTDAAFWLAAAAFFATAASIYILSRRATAEFERAVA